MSQNKGFLYFLRICNPNCNFFNYCSYNIKRSTDTIEHTTMNDAENFDDSLRLKNKALEYCANQKSQKYVHFYRFEGFIPAFSTNFY